MKKIIIVITLIAFSVSSFAQRRFDNEWFLSVGLNAINSLGSRNPAYKPGEWSFQFPISAAAEFKWSDDLSIEQSVTFNGFTEDNTIDNADLKEDYNYLSFDTHIKYYFGDYIFPRTYWIDFYANAGIGFFHIDKTNISANLGGGVLFWFNRDQKFGIRTQVIGKFAFDHPDSGFDNNHFQYHLQAVFRL